ncbi:peptidoglycan-binding protein [Brachybacterium halotolerans subsp. kimchii]|uniref:peptidoglycan-binding protein n=1 Tax=Brachybacterium halotolerans TaxID=2795215 RepID=UPI001E3099B8|nr:peptidoglycan-binding protein [Brachybacterium halotolerans]UEJ84022.1 peptidoglycan-binding protein [Brachybacterium halotolerans subsp. kimchii]
MATMVNLPKAYSNKGKVEQARADAAAAFTRMMLRAVAETNTNFSVWSAYRSKQDQIGLFLQNYTRVSRGRKYSTDRAYNGSIWAMKSGGVRVASPDIPPTGQGADHRSGIGFDVHPSAIQAWMKTNATRFGFNHTVGYGVEPWHVGYRGSTDQYRAEGLPDIVGMQKKLGITADGKPGTGFVAAVKKFQKANGLTVDGIAGPKTQKAILAGKGEAAQAAVKPAATVTPTVQATPGWMPGVDTSQTWTGNSHKAPVTKIVLHTTEGSGFVDYQGGKVAPHFTVHRDGRIRQHFPTTQSAKALEHPAGTVETNNGGVIQIEFIGSCDRVYAAKNGLFFTEDAQDVDLAGLASVLAWVSAAHGIPLTADGLTWPTTNAAYTSAPQRMSDSDWLTYAGVCGHTHVPHNSHWDPGAFPVARLLELAGGAAPATGKPSTPSTGGTVTLPDGKALLMKLKDLPDFPLLRTAEHKCYYGDESKIESVSGKSPNSLNPGEILGTGKSSGARGLKAWQKKMGLTTDGRFGAKTEAAARKLQKAAGLTVDGKIGPTTFYAAWLVGK